MEHLRFADYVVVLEKGGKVAQAAPGDEIRPIDTEVKTVDNEDETAQPSKPAQDAPELTLSEMGIPDPEEEANAESRRKGDYHAYAYYSQIAGWKNISIWLFFSSVFMFGLNFPCKSLLLGVREWPNINLISLEAVWLQWWVNSNADEPNNRIGYWLGVYASLACVAIMANIVSDW